MKSDNKPVIGLICVVLSCILVMGITLGLLSSANNTALAGLTTDTTDNTPDNTPDTTKEFPAEEPQPEPELIWGYEPRTGESSCFSPEHGHMGYKSDKKTFDIDNVKLTLAYGVLAYYEIDEFAIEYYYRNHLGLDIPEFEIYFGDEFKNNIYTLREVKESFINEKYRVAGVGNDCDYRYEFNHLEEITIPKELFTESEGIIIICVGGMNVAGDEPKYEVLCSEQIKYQLIENDKVILSPRWEY